jgi:hypothetical protein
MKLYIFSDSSSVHHQKLIHCTLSKVNKLLMMDRRTVRRNVDFHDKINL